MFSIKKVQWASLFKLLVKELSVLICISNFVVIIFPSYMFNSSKQTGRVVIINRVLESFQKYSNIGGLIKGYYNAKMKIPLKLNTLK